MNRYTDFSIALLICLVVLIPCAAIAILIRLTSKGPAIYWSERMGRSGKPFLMPKFRTMMVDTPVEPTDNLHRPEQYITQLGSFLRKTSIDELPQLFSVLRGDMSLVGPRPVLSVQTDLLEKRHLHGIDKLRPGITGWAQINGRDDVPMSEKVLLEIEYLERRSFTFDLKILWLTLFYVLSSKGISH